jgi:ribosomal-protein-alanine N-acetyltransferase
MHLLPIKQRLEDNKQFTTDSLVRLTVEMTIDFYKKVGFVEPWIGYYVELDGDLVGSAGFKGPPVNGIVELAYGTDEKYRNMGIGTKICKLLVDLSLKTDPLIKITAKTFSKYNYSTRILQKNKFICIGTVNDPEDGEVWEWLFSIGT